jgi:hypothetical protein
MTSYIHALLNGRHVVNVSEHQITPSYFYDAVYNRYLSYRGQCLTIHQLIYSYVTMGIHSSFVFNINSSVTHLDLL